MTNTALNPDEQAWLDSVRALADYRTELLMQHAVGVPDSPEVRSMMRNLAIEVWANTGNPEKAATEDMSRVSNAAVRIEGIRAILNPAIGPGTYALPDGAKPSDVVAHPQNFVVRNVVALKIEGYEHECVLIARPGDAVAAEVSPPYFTGWGAKKKMREVRSMALAGLYWGYDSLGREGWQPREVGNPEPLDIRGPDDLSLYDSLCPRVT